MSDGTMNSRFDDDGLDGLLADLRRPLPGRGFADRVLARTRLPFPTWLKPLRDALRGMFTGVRGWTLLAILALSSAGTWTLVGVSTWNHRAAIASGAEITASEVGVPTLQSVQGVRDVLIERLFDWLPLSLPVLKMFLILYAAVALVCALGLWWLLRTPRAAEVQHG